MLQFLLNLNKEVISRLEGQGLFQEKVIYIAQTTEIIQKIIQTINENNDVSTIGREKTSLVQIIRALIKTHKWNIDLTQAITVVEKDTCHSCLSRADFIIDDGNEYCEKCNAFQYFSKSKLTTRDFSRINIVSRFVYSRTTHFKDCMKQYQGRQNAAIPDNVMEALDKKFIRYKLVDPTKTGPQRYHRITKAHIITFLRELKFNKHYENTNLIYFKLRGEYFDSIKHLEFELLDRFKQLLELYDDMKPETNRKNFMNIQYILFQLLKSLNHPCSLEDFTFLKTSDRKRYHDDICRKIFNKLGWKFTNL